jgi:AcrR family transcriptional regulator
VETKESLNGHQIRSIKSTRALIRAAGDLVAEGGYQTMTLASVGERAGYSRSLATARFGSKAKLLEALVDEIVVRWNLEKLEPEVSGLRGLENLRVFLSEIRESYKKNPRSLTILYALVFEALGPAPDLRDRFITFHRILRLRIASTIRNGIEDGSIRPGIDPEQQADLIAAQLRGVGYLWQLDPESIDPASVLTLFIDQWMHTLASDQAALDRVES